MANETYLSSFPANPAQALAMEYVKSQDLTGLTPRQITAMFYKALKEVRLAIGSATNDSDGFAQISED